MIQEILLGIVIVIILFFVIIYLYVVAGLIKDWRRK